jgi:tRNA pseudouridine55 synthase
MGSPPSDGILLVDKPAGMTSHDVVATTRRSLGERRVGHAGTLDPFATGLLVLLVGRATRLLPYIDGEPKVYEAVIRFGTETDTDDSTGEPTRQAGIPPREDVERAIQRLTGPIDQIPPAYSAKQVAGRRAYAAARAGEALDLAPASVTVHEWRIASWTGDDLRVTISCSGGTYIRALARDLGRLTESAAHLASLRRLRSGPFDVSDGVDIETLRAARPALRSPLEALGSLAIEPLDELAIDRIMHGRAVPARADGERAALVDAAGDLVAIAMRSGGEWQPRVVLREAEAGAS